MGHEAEPLTKLGSKLRRRNWEAIYHYITETDAVATLALVEQANDSIRPVAGTQLSTTRHVRS